jgi:hypothetical protein
MFVPCPHCQFLVAHHPQLRPMPADCPRCGRPLDEDALVETAQVEEVAHDAAAQPGEVETGASVTDATSAVAPAIDPAIDEEPKDTASLAPAATLAFASPARGRGLVRWTWPLIAALALLLVVQLLLADRARLAGDARWRPLLEQVCGALQCELPPWQEPSAFTMLDRKVRPATPGALRVDATFRNDARWAQPWPALQLALSDADGRILGSHVFQAQDYLGAAPATRLAPGQSAQITFLVQEPAPGTVAFSFEFR